MAAYPARKRFTRTIPVSVGVGAAGGQCLLGITITLLQSFHRLTSNLSQHFPNPLIDVVRPPRTPQWHHVTRQVPGVAPQCLVRPASIVEVFLPMVQL